jgi:predicted transposase YbfD/YdcC
MDSDGTRFAEIAEMTSFLHYFSELPDHRQPGKVDYPLPEVLLLILLAVLAGAEAFTDIARFGERKIELQRRFRPYVDGTPSHDHLGDIFATLDARAFQLCFVAWVAALTNTPAEVIAIDGKTSRRSYQTKGSKEAIHMVSAFAARQRIVLGQVKVSEKSNEIVAIPALLDMMSIEGAVVTIDAMGCQRDIATKIIEKKADYIVALKGNQGTLHEDVEVVVDEQKALKYKDTTISTHETVDGDHGRIETRNYTVIHDVDWLQQRHQWPGLKAVVVVESRREINGKITDETRFYITSLVMLAAAVGPMIRAHWAIENSLHWVMDMVFRDDECRVRTDNAPANFATCRHIAYNLTRKARVRIPSASGAKPQGGTTSTSPASSQRDYFHPIPLVPDAVFNDLFHSCSRSAEDNRSRAKHFRCDRVHRFLVIVRLEQMAIAIHRHLEAAVTGEGLHRFRT